MLKFQPRIGRRMVRQYALLRRPWRPQMKRNNSRAQMSMLIFERLLEAPLGRTP